MPQYKTIINPVNALIKPLQLKFDRATVIPIPGSDALLSIIPEYLSETTARYFYNQDKVLTLNCAIKRAGIEDVYLEFVDEKDFYLFMDTFKDNQDKYKPSRNAAKMAKLLGEYNARN